MEESTAKDFISFLSGERHYTLSDLVEKVWPKIRLISLMAIEIRFDQTKGYMFQIIVIIYRIHPFLF